MKYFFANISTLIIIVSLCFFAADNVFAQRTVEVPQGFGTLNEAIDSDTTEAGDRVDPNTVYVLERGGTYILNGTIQNRGFHLRIEAEPGDGPRPVLRPGVPDGGSSSHPFRVRDDLTLRGLYVTNRDELDGLLTRMLRVSADSVRIVIDDCHLDEEGQAAFRLDNPYNRIFITNSIISNIGLPISPDNGRGIDDRGNSIDTLVMENNTFYNLTSRVLRKTAGTLNYARINHNTFFNIGQMIFTFDEVIEGSFTNNNVFNGAFSGRETNPEGFTANFTGIEVKELGQDLIDQGYTQTLDIRNNNFYLDPDIVDVYPDTIEVTPIFNDVAQSFIDAAGTGDTILEEAVEFENSPPSELTMVDMWWGDRPNAPGWDNSGAPFDFAYETTAESYTASTAGQPLGALKWFDMVVSVNDNWTPHIAEEYELYSNYPNPFNPETTIRYQIGNREHVSLIIYNALGQRVATLVDDIQEVGVHNVRWNGMTDSGRILPSGVYLYQLQTDSFSATRKMIMLK